MKFGFFMMPSHSHTENPTLAFERDLGLIEYAETLGFDEFSWRRREPAPNGSVWVRR